MVVTKRTAGHRAKGQGRARARETSHPSPPHLPSVTTDVVVAQGWGSRHRRMRGRIAALVTRGRCVRRAQRGRAHLATSRAATTGRGGSPVGAYLSGRSCTASLSFPQPQSSSLTAERGDGGLEVEGIIRGRQDRQGGEQGRRRGEVE